MGKRKHYHVLCGLRGCYMPDSNLVCATRREAERCAAWEAKSYRDDADEDMRVSGSARSGYYRVGDSYCIQITTCDMADCEVSDD